MKYDEIVEINGCKYQRCGDDFIGKGGYGTVWEVKRLSDDKHFAFKETNRYYQNQEIELPRDILKRIKEKAEREISFLNGISNPKKYHILPIEGAGEYNGMPAMVMPLADHSLAAFYNARIKNETPFGIDDLIRWLRQILTALDKIHSTKGKHGNEDEFYVHRDLKFGNVLIMDDDAYLSDFGGIKLVGGDETTSLFAAPEWTAPELLIPKRFAKPQKRTENPKPQYHVTPKADMFCLGLLINALLTGRPLKCQSLLEELAPDQRKPSPKSAKRFGKIGGIDNQECIKLKAAFLRLVFPDKQADETYVPKDIEPLPEPESIGGAIVDLVRNMVHKTPEHRWSAGKATKQLKKLSALIHPKLESLTIECPAEIEINKSFAAKLIAKGTGLVDAPSWLHIEFDGRTVSCDHVLTTGNTCWKVLLWSNSKPKGTMVRAEGYAGDIKIETGKDVNIVKPPGVLWEKGKHYEALIRRPANGKWLRQIVKESKKSDDRNKYWLLQIEKVINSSSEGDCKEVRLAFQKLQSISEKRLQGNRAHPCLFAAICLVSILSIAAYFFLIKKSNSVDMLAGQDSNIGYRSIPETPVQQIDSEKVPKEKYVIDVKEILACIDYSFAALDEPDTKSTIESLKNLETGQPYYFHHPKYSDLFNLPENLSWIKKSVISFYLKERGLHFLFDLLLECKYLENCEILYEKLCLDEKYGYGPGWCEKDGYYTDIDYFFSDLNGDSIPELFTNLGGSYCGATNPCEDQIFKLDLTQKDIVPIGDIYIPHITDLRINGYKVICSREPGGYGMDLNTVNDAENAYYSWTEYIHIEEPCEWEYTKELRIDLFEIARFLNIKHDRIDIKEIWPRPCRMKNRKKVFFERPHSQDASNDRAEDGDLISFVTQEGILIPFAEFSGKSWGPYYFRKTLMEDWWLYVDDKDGISLTLKDKVEVNVEGNERTGYLTSLSDQSLTDAKERYVFEGTCVSGVAFNKKRIRASRLEIEKYNSANIFCSPIYNCFEGKDRYLSDFRMCDSDRYGGESGDCESLETIGYFSIGNGILALFLDRGEGWAYYVFIEAEKNEYGDLGRGTEFFLRLYDY